MKDSKGHGSIRRPGGTKAPWKGTWGGVPDSPGALAPGHAQFLAAMQKLQSDVGSRLSQQASQTGINSLPRRPSE